MKKYRRQHVFGRLQGSTVHFDCGAYASDLAAISDLENELGLRDL